MKFYILFLTVLTLGFSCNNISKNSIPKPEILSFFKEYAAVKTLHCFKSQMEGANRLINPKWIDSYELNQLKSFNLSELLPVDYGNSIQIKGHWYWKVQQDYYALYSITVGTDKSEFLARETRIFKLDKSNKVVDNYLVSSWIEYEGESKLCQDIKFDQKKAILVQVNTRSMNLEFWND